MKLPNDQERAIMRAQDLFQELNNKKYIIFDDEDSIELAKITKRVAEEARKRKTNILRLNELVDKAIRISEKICQKQQTTK